MTIKQIQITSDILISHEYVVIRFIFWTVNVFNEPITVFHTVMVEDFFLAVPSCDGSITTATMIIVTMNQFRLLNLQCIVYSSVLFNFERENIQFAQ